MFSQESTLILSYLRRCVVHLWHSRKPGASDGASIMFRIATGSAGRGLYATQPIAPGDEIFSEHPAYFIRSEGNDEKEGHETLAAHILASASPSHRQAISELVSNVDHFRQQEQRRLAVSEAVEPVRKLIRDMPIQQALSVISPSSSSDTEAAACRAAQADERHLAAPATRGCTARQSSGTPRPGPDLATHA